MNLEELLRFEDRCLDADFEGIMLRDPFAPYKQGRGTWREGIIMKLKRFQDDEGIIVDFEEQVHNTNILCTDDLGYAKRSTNKEHMIPADTLGNFLVLFNDEIINVAPGQFTHIQRQNIWNNQEYYKGLILKFRHFPHGVKDKPRFPRAIGFRNPIDM
jgi:DNA ligase 1